MQHIQKLRNIEGFEAALIVFLPESNLAFEGLWIDDALKKSGVRNLITMKEDDNRAGVRINKEFKQVMAYTLNQKFMQENILFHESFLTTSDQYTTPEMKKDMISQFNNFSEITEPSKNPLLPSRVFYSGKRDGFDDHVIATQINLFMQTRFFTSQDYKDYW